MFASGDLWLLMTVGGVIALGVMLAVTMAKNRKVTPEEARLSQRATKELYEAERRDPANQH